MGFYEEDQCVRCGDVLVTHPSMTWSDFHKKARKDENFYDEMDDCKAAQQAPEKRIWPERSVMRLVQQEAVLGTTFWWIPLVTFRRKYTCWPKDLGVPLIRLNPSQAGKLHAEGVIARPRPKDPPFKYQTLQLKTRFFVQLKEHIRKHDETLREGEAMDFFLHACEADTESRGEDHAYVTMGVVPAREDVNALLIC